VRRISPLIRNGDNKNFAGTLKPLLWSDNTSHESVAVFVERFK